MRSAGEWKALVWASLLVGTSGSMLLGQDTRVLLEVRLLDPVRSVRHNEGAAVRAELIRPVALNGHIVMPAGSLVSGRIQQVRPVGLGIRREQALVQVAFKEWTTPEGTSVPIDTRLVEIDNAREQVDKQGRIQGILGASSPLGLARGIWFRPSARLLFRGPLGLTGAVGTASSHLPLGYLGAAGLIGARLLLTRLPEPEIDLPSGTEMTLELLSDLPAKSWGRLPAENAPAPTLSEFLQQQPRKVRKPDGSKVADLINLAFLGDEDTLEQAFRAAGWVPADTLTKKSFGRAYKSFVARQGYAAAPVSRLLYEGSPPDLVFQKSLNSIAKRHHIRLWRVNGPGDEEVWLGAATHDVSVTFDRKRFSLTHRIDPDLDQEREKVMADLEYTGALAWKRRLPGPPVQRQGFRTDGAIRIAGLQEVKMRVAPPAAAFAARPATPFRKRVVRRVALESKHYLLRDNTYYLGYVGVRSIWRGWMKFSADRAAQPAPVPASSQQATLELCCATSPIYSVSSDWP